jgi:hypothetical protein
VALLTAGGEGHRRASPLHSASAYSQLVASADLSRRVEKVVDYPPLAEMDDRQRREFHEALLDAGAFEDLPGKWQAAILEAEQNRPKLRLTATSPSARREPAQRVHEVRVVGADPALPRE